MQITLDTETRDYLRKLRKKERDKRHYIKISVILALDATHLYEAGTDSCMIQEFLGHNISKITEIYAHVSNRTIQKVQSPFDALMQDRIANKSSYK